MTHGIAKLTHDGLLLTVTTKGKKTTVTTVTQYVVTDTRPDPRVASPAFRLTKEDGEFYDVHCDGYGAHCSCPDGTYRSKAQGCKHCRALRAVGLLPRS